MIKMKIKLLTMAIVFFGGCANAKSPQIKKPPKSSVLDQEAAYELSKAKSG